MFTIHSFVAATRVIASVDLRFGEVSFQTRLHADEQITDAAVAAVAHQQLRHLVLARCDGITVRFIQDVLA